MNMKYLKPASAVLVGSSVSGFNRATTEECTATLGLTTVFGDGSGEQLQGIYVTRSQLEQIRDEIDNYLRNTAEGQPKLGVADSLREPEAMAVASSFNFNITGDSKLSKEEIGKLFLEIAQRVTKTQECQTNDTEQKQKLRINPKIVKIEQGADQVSPELYRASIDDWRNLTDNRAGCIYLYALGDSEEEARATLNEQFEALILRFADPETTSSETSSATFQDRFAKLKEELSNQSPKVKAFVEAVTRITRSEASKPMPNLDDSEKVDHTPAPESKKAEPQKAEEKSQVFKLNPNRVASRRNPAIKGYGQWEARITLYFGEMPLEVVSSGHMTEESARTALDYKVERLMDGLTT